MAIAMVLASLGPRIQQSKHKYTKILVGIGADGTTDTSPFVVGNTDAAGYATAMANGVTDYICEEVRIDGITHSGRVFYYGTFTKFVAG